MTVTCAQAISAFQQNSQTAPLVVSDSAANILANLDALQTIAAAGRLASLTLADDNYVDQQQIYLTGPQLANDAAALSKLFGCYSLPITSALTAAQAASIGLDHAITLAIAPAVADTAANLAANVDALAAMAAALRISSITVTDGGTLTVTAAQADADAAALALIQNAKTSVSNLDGGTLDIATGGSLPSALAPGTDVVLQGAGTWHVGGTVSSGATFEFAASYATPVLEADSATFGANTHIVTQSGAGELLAAGVTAFGGTLTAHEGNLTLDIESGGGVAGQFHNTGTMLTGVGGGLTVQSASAGILVNAGTIDDALGQMDINVALDNHGLIEVQDDGRLTVAGAVTNESDGQIILSDQFQNDFSRMQLTGPLLNNGQIVDDTGILVINGPVSGTGSIVLGDGANLYNGGTVEVEIKGSVAAGQHILFGAGQGLVKLDDAAGFHGTVDNFNFKDLIDLAGVQADSTTYNATTGLLTVLSGSTQVAQFTLTGGSPLYAFTDGQGGAYLSLQPYGTPAQLVQVMTQGTVAGDPMLPNWSSALSQASGIPFLPGAGWSFTASGTPIVTYSIGSSMNSAQVAAVVNALDLWSSVCNIQFQAAPAGTVGRIDFQTSTQGLSDTVPHFDSAGNCLGNTIYIDTVAACWADFTDLAAHDPAWGNSGFTAILHEIGHAIGLDHPAVYAATCYGEITQQLFYTDSQQYTVMSYFEAPYTGADVLLFPAGVAIHPQTPMMDDILAVQSIYGANTQTLAGNETFGFNSTFGPNSANPIREYDFTQNSVPMVTLWSGGTNNTLDLSGFAQNATVNLQPGTFSSAGGYTGNLAIAIGTHIDHAIGGAGDDVFTVNADNDVIDGGGGSNTVVFGGTSGQYKIVATSHGVTVTGNGVTDTLSNIQTLQFADAAIPVSSVMGPPQSIQVALQDYGAGSLTAPVTVSDSAADVTGNLSGLETLAASGKLASIMLTDAGMASLSVTATQLAQDAQAIHAIAGSYNLSVAGVSPTTASFILDEDASGRGADGIALDYAGTAPAGGNSVIGFQSATLIGGDNAILLTGPRSSYELQVSTGGVVTLKDVGIGDASYGQTVTVTGASYVIFNGGSCTTVDGLPVYSQIYFVENAADAQLAQFYAAATQFKSSIALSGLEYWENQLAGGQSLSVIAQSFLDTNYFQTTYGDPGTTHAQHLAYVQALYQNILGMTLSSTDAGVLYWADDMDNGMSGATALISFTNATATTSTLNAVSGTTAGSGSGWLIAPSVTGGYADPGLQESASSVLAQASTSQYYNLSLIDPSTVPGSGIASAGVTLASGAVTIAATAAPCTVVLSAAFTQATIGDNGSAVHDGPGIDSITVTGAGDTVSLGSAASDSLNLADGSGTFVFGFVPGKGSLLAVSGTAHPVATTLLNGTTTAVQGSSLNFGTTAVASPIFVNIGSVGGGSAAEVVAAANKAYLVADINGNATTGALGEHVVFLGTDSGGNTEIWSFRAPLSSVTVSGHTVQAPIAGADTAGAHAVTAAEMTLVATLIGVSAANLAAADLA